ncbi:hypothetical protein, partial [Escherichia coli]|uniref:hypothetical protein n=1 Tax=Escherichia coli TaxID=562 RepID=UPI001BDB846A
SAKNEYSFSADMPWLSFSSSRTRSQPFGDTCVNLEFFFAYSRSSVFFFASSESCFSRFSESINMIFSL